MQWYLWQSHRGYKSCFWESSSLHLKGLTGDFQEWYKSWHQNSYVIALNLNPIYCIALKKQNRFGFCFSLTSLYWYWAASSHLCINGWKRSYSGFVIFPCPYTGIWAVISHLCIVLNIMSTIYLQVGEQGDLRANTQSRGHPYIPTELPGLTRGVLQVCTHYISCCIQKCIICIHNIPVKIDNQLNRCCYSKVIFLKL